MAFIVKIKMKGCGLTMKKTKKITICALLVAMSTVLAFLSKLIPAPWMQGGSVTLASAVPVILTSLLFGVKWGVASSVTYATIQMITGFYPPPTQDFLSFFAVVMIDYMLAFGVYGLAGLFYKKNRTYTIPLSGFLVVLMRYICHILSGILIWGVYAGEGQTVFAYSLIYNGSYMIPEIIITTLVLFGMIKFIHMLDTD